MHHRIPYRLLGYVIGIHACWFILALCFRGIYLVDSFGYLDQAKNIVDYGSWYSESWNMPVMIDYFSLRPPLYAIFITASKYISSSDYLILFFQNIISVAEVCLVYRICLQYGASPRSAQVAILLSLILFPVQLVLTNMVMSEILFQGLLFWTFDQCLCFSRRSGGGRALAISLGCSLLLLTKPVALFFPFAAIAWMVYCLHQQQLLKMRMLVVTLIPMVIVGITFHLICLQQRHQTGYYHYCSLKPITQLRYNARYTLAHHSGETSAERFNDSCKAVLKAQGSYGERYRLMEEMGNGVLKKYPIDFAILYLKGCIAFMLDPGRHDLFAFFYPDDAGGSGLFHGTITKGTGAWEQMLNKSPLPGLIMLAISLVWNIIMVASLVLFLFSRHIPLLLRLCVGLVVGYILAATGILGVARYRTAVYPELMIAAVFAYDRITNLRAKRHGRISV